MAVRNWIDGFLERHKARFNPNDWPDAESSDEMDEYVRCWVTAFVLKDVAEKEADEASRRLVLAPPNWRRDHIPAVVAAVEQLRAEKGPAAGAGGTREAARSASRDCPHCGGEGLALVWHRHPSPERRIAPTASATCICSHGKWIRKVWADTDPQMLRRIPDLAVVLRGESVFVADDPAGISWEIETPTGTERGEIE